MSVLIIANCASLTCFPVQAHPGVGVWDTGVQGGYRQDNYLGEPWVGDDGGVCDQVEEWHCISFILHALPIINHISVCYNLVVKI